MTRTLRDAPIQPTLPVTDLARARQFYEGLLGLELVEETIAGLRFACGGGTSLFVYPRDDAAPGDRTMAEFQVQDLDSLVKDLEARGVRFLDYDLAGLETVDHIASLGPFRVAWFTDPDGNILALNE